MVNATQIKPDWMADFARLKQDYSVTKSAKTLIDLRDFRLSAGEKIAERPEGATLTPCPPLAENPFPNVKNDIPAVKMADLTPEVLAGAMRHHGALIIKGMASAQKCAEMREQIDNVMDAADVYFNSSQADRAKMVQGDGELNSWFKLFDNIADYTPRNTIRMMQDTGSVWTFLSPMMTQNLTQYFDDLGLRELLSDYFDDDPCLSFMKCVLRRVEPLAQNADWHQDGSFMNTDIKSLNLWMALTDCGAGTSSPGMDLVPKRLTEVVETGTNGAAFNWSVSHKSVNEWFKDTPPVRPHFEEGDAIFFDHLNLHVTSYDETFTQNRYAIETWFFAQSHNPKNQHPALW